jgi:hypothetical protein
MIAIDPSKLEQVLGALDPDELRVFTWLLALLDEDGSLVGAEMRLARRVGLHGPAELRLVLDRLASVRFGAAPLIARDLLRGRPRLRLIGPPGLVRHHGRSAARAADVPTEQAPVPTVTAMRNRRRAAPPQDLLKVRGLRAKEVELVSPVLAQLTESWLAMLASYASDDQLTLAAQVRQYDVVFELMTTYGPDATEAAFIAGERIIEQGGGPKGRPESLLRKLARNAFEQAKTGNAAETFIERGRRRTTGPEQASTPEPEPEPDEDPQFPPDDSADMPDLF